MPASTTLESTEPNAKGIFANMNDNICQHTQKAMNSTNLAMKITKVHNEELETGQESKKSNEELQEMNRKNMCTIQRGKKKFGTHKCL